MTRTSYEIDGETLKEQFIELQRKSGMSVKEATEALWVSLAYISSTARNWNISAQKLGKIERLFLEYWIQPKFLIDK